MPTSTAATTTRASSPLESPVSLIGTVSRELGRIVAGNFEIGAAWKKISKAELRDLAAGRKPQPHPGDIALFKSNGIALEDVAVAGREVVAAERDGDRAQRQARVPIRRRPNDSVQERPDSQKSGQTGEEITARIRSGQSIHAVSGSAH